MQTPKKYLIPQILEKNAADHKMQPKVYMVCGTEDFLYSQTVKVREACRKRLKEFYYEEWHGIHEWDVWDKAIERMLKLFLGEGRKDN